VRKTPTLLPQIEGPWEGSCSGLNPPAKCHLSESVHRTSLVKVRTYTYYVIRIQMTKAGELIVDMIAECEKGTFRVLVCFCFLVIFLQFGLPLMMLGLPLHPQVCIKVPMVDKGGLSLGNLFVADLSEYCSMGRNA
jgi:hypothetical protein